VGGRVGRIDADPKIAQPGSGQPGGQTFGPVGDAAARFGLQREAVGARTDIRDTGTMGVLDQLDQVVEAQQRLSAGKRDGGHTLGGGGVEHPLDVVGRQRVALENRLPAHAALGTAGVAAVGDLDDQLAGHSSPDEVADE
jgi:hypothetical protein